MSKWKQKELFTEDDEIIRTELLAKLRTELFAEDNERIQKSIIRSNYAPILRNNTYFIQGFLEGYSQHNSSDIVFLIENEEIIKITHDGFYYKGEKVEDDAQIVYNKMKEFLNLN